MHVTEDGHGSVETAEAAAPPVPEQPSDTERAAWLAATGPLAPAQSPMGPLGRLARRAILRLIRPFTAYQQQVNEQLVHAVIRLEQQLADPASQQHDHFEPLLGGWPIRELPEEMKRNLPLTYNNDGLATWGKDASFLTDQTFVTAYQRALHSEHSLGNQDSHIEWRVHAACWAATHAKQLPGSFVECGVNGGFFSLAICNYIDFNSTGKDFFLFDTFQGIPEEQMAGPEREDRLRENADWYRECYDLACRNFSPFPRARLIRGKVPDTLDSVDTGEVCYLSLDMNIAYPEIAAIEFFWDKLVTGAPVLLDDYGWLNYPLQKEEMDKFASRKGVEIFTLPTGQGLLLKP